MTALRVPVQVVLSLLTAAVVILTSTLAHAQTSEGALSGAVPPLGALIREYENVTRDGATAYAIWTTQEAVPHQVWFRIAGGEALHRQRLRVYQENLMPRPMNTLPPATALVQEVRSNTPTGWYALNSEQGVSTYYIDGDHRTRRSDLWENDDGVRVQRARYENGILYRIQFEDIPKLDDYDDLVVEVAFIQAQ
ncbi:MAG TPA: hypothetical protein V6D07_06510 [Trichocoleus sp.]